MPTRLKILHADDEEGWRELAAFWLTQEGYDVRSVDAGKGVLALARTWRPDCFLLDHDLGDMSGREVCGTIKSSAEFKTIPVIIMTAHADVLSAVIERFPPDQFIVKSNHGEELVLILEELLSGK